MSQFHLKIEDLPFLSIMNAKIDMNGAEVEVIMGHEKHDIPMFSVNMIFFDKRDGEWLVHVEFYAPGYVYLYPVLEERVKFYLVEIFGQILDEYIEATNPIIDVNESFREEIRQDLAGLVLM